jgi:hypothetical protein
VISIVTRKLQSEVHRIWKTQELASLGDEMAKYYKKIFTPFLRHRWE